MSFSKTLSEIASQGVTAAEFDALDVTTGAAGATTFLRGDKQWQTAGSTSATDLTSGTLPAARLPVGTVLQTKMIRYDDPITLATGTPGAAFTGVRLTITPVSANSVLFMQWSLSGEAASDASGWRIYKNGSAITTAGYEGQVEGASPAVYDVYSLTGFGGDEWSSPTTETFSYYDKPGSISVVYYEPRAWHSTTGGAATRYINRPTGSAGTASYENCVSFGIIQEIADNAITEVVL